MLAEYPIRSIEALKSRSREWRAATVAAVAAAHAVLLRSLTSTAMAEAGSDGSAADGFIHRWTKALWISPDGVERAVLLLLLAMSVAVWSALIIGWIDRRPFRGEAKACPGNRVHAGIAVAILGGIGWSAPLLGLSGALWGGADALAALGAGDEAARPGGLLRLGLSLATAAIGFAIAALAVLGRHVLSPRRTHRIESQHDAASDGAP